MEESSTKIKEISASLVFLQQNYRFCKYLLISDWITKVLIDYYDIIIKQGFYLER